MKSKIIFLLSMFPLLVFSQGVTNNGAKIVISSGAYVYVDGGTNGNFVNKTNVSDGSINNDGNLIVEGNFSNNTTGASANVFTNINASGKVTFAGANQNISNTNNFINFENVKINSGSTTNLLAGSAATINTNLDLDAAGQLRLKTPLSSAPSGSLITNGTITSTQEDDIIVERYFNMDSRYQYFSTPVQNSDISNFCLPPSGSYNANVYKYNEAYDAAGIPANTNYATWNNTTYGFANAWTNVASPTTGTYFTPAVGYTSLNELNFTINFQGGNSKLNNTTIYSPLVSFTSNDGNSNYFDGWNLVGNPYPCGLDWSAIGWTKTGISNSIYFWNGTNYVYYCSGTLDNLNYGDVTVNGNGGSAIIPAMQSFFIKATAPIPAFIIPASARVHSSQTMYKTTENIENYDYVKLQLSQNNLSDQTYIRFIADATLQVDDKLDAFKVFSQTENLPQIFSLTEDTETGIPMAINSLPSQSLGTSTPIGVVSKTVGIYTFSAEELNILESGSVYLIDKNNNGNEVWIDLNTNTYTCLISQGEIRNRFYLFVGVSSNILTEIKNNNYEIYSNLSKIYIKLNNDLVKGTKMEVYNTIGQILYTEVLKSNFNELDLNLASGEYVVKLININNIFYKKVFIY